LTALDSREKETENAMTVNTTPPRRKPKHPRRRDRNPGARDFYAKGNREAAEIILQDVERYGGECSLLVQWARLFLENERRAMCAPAGYPDLGNEPFNLTDAELEREWEQQQ
jgi:hypothetical protein